MANIDIVNIRAEIGVGGANADLKVRTPYIQSFTVRKSRGQISTFEASLKVSQDELVSNSIGGEVYIKAGKKDSLNKIFTGIIKKASLAPCWDDPGYVFLNISGEDCLSLLKGKKYTRRCRVSKGVWVSIDSIVRRGIRDTRFSYDMNPIQISEGDTKKNETAANTDPVDLASNAPHAPVTKTESRVTATVTHIVESDEG